MDLETCPLRRNTCDGQNACTSPPYRMVGTILVIASLVLCPLLSFMVANFFFCMANFLHLCARVACALWWARCPPPASSIPRFLIPYVPAPPSPLSMFLANSVIFPAEVTMLSLCDARGKPSSFCSLCPTRCT
eukprot:1296613-Pyramimonas_sp.AAC.1